MYASWQEVALPHPMHDGRYEPALVARWLGMHHSTVRRWLATSPSYRTDRAMVVRSNETPRRLASFLDLVELYIAKELIGRGIGPRKLRRALRETSERLGVDHPLARRQFLVDGRSLYLPIDDQVIDLGEGGQLGLGPIIRERAEKLEFDLEGLAKRWWPAGRGGHVVVDPEVGYGVPVVEGTGTSTAVLHTFWIAEGRDSNRVADWYGLPVEDVKRAVEFEERVAA